MRAFAWFFACYLTLLGCLPCADVPAWVGPEGGEQAVAASPRPAHSQEADWCSPLCQCRCCAGVVLPVGSSSLPAARLLARVRILRRFAAPHTPAVPRRAPAAPWQPPQLLA